MARVSIEIEKIGDMWRGEVVGSRGARRRDRASDWLSSLDEMLAWVADSVPEVDSLPPAVAEPVQPQPSLVDAALVRSLVEDQSRSRSRRGAR